MFQEHLKNLWEDAFKKQCFALSYSALKDILDQHTVREHEM